MTPLEIAEYKQRWMSSDSKFNASVHSDLRSKAKQWCKQLRKEEWTIKAYTNVYEDTFFFESESAYNNFVEEFADWITE